MCRPGRFSCIRVSASASALKKLDRSAFAPPPAVETDFSGPNYRRGLKSPVPSIAMIRSRFYDLERVMATPDFDAG
jgi:hypothetical protein